MSPSATILLVSDQPELASQLRAWGHRLAGPGDTRPDLLLLDATSNVERLPERILDLRAEHGELPLLVCGPADAARAAVRAMRAGAQDWLESPLDERALAEAVEEAFLRRRLRQEGRETLRFLEEQGRLVEDERRFLGQRVTQMAAELEGAHEELRRAHRQLQGRVSQLVMLYRIGRDLSREPNWDQALSSFLEGVCHFLGARGAALLLCSEGGRRLAPRRVHALDEPSVRRAVEMLGAADRPLPGDPDLCVLDTLPRGGPTPCMESSAAWHDTVVPLRHRDLDLGYLVLRKSYASSEAFEEDFYFLITVQTILTEEVAGAQAFSALRKLQRFHERTLDHVGSGVVTVDEAGEVLYWNEPARMLLGGEPREARLAERLRLGSERVPLDAWLSEVGGGAPAVSDGWLAMGGDGAVPMSVLASRLPGELPGEFHHVLILRDERARRELEAERRRAARQDELLIMAAEWAHDVRTPLTGILHGAELISEALPPDSPKRRHWPVIQGEVQRINELVSNFLDFARPVRLKPTPTDLRTLAEGCASFLGGVAVERGLQLHFECTLADPLVARVDPDPLRQVLLNLLHNAMDASPDGGSILLRLAREDGPSVLDAARPAASAAVLEVEDEGVGVADAHLDRLFVPFFTTKPEGTGLGLAISEKIVRAHQGHLRYERRGDRTVLRVVLPAVGEESLETETGARSPLEARG